MRSGDRYPAMASHERAALLTVMTSASDPSLDGLYSASSSNQKLEPKSTLAEGCQLLHLPAGLLARGSAMPWQDEVGSCGPCPLFEKGAELKWVYTGTSNDKMYIEIYKDFYINLIKQ